MLSSSSSRSAIPSAQESSLSTVLKRENVKVILEETKDILQGRISERTGELSVDEPVSRVMSGIVEVVQLFLQEGIQQRTVEEIVVAVQQFQEQTSQAGRVIPQAHRSERTAKQSADNHAHQSVGEVFAEFLFFVVPKISSQDRILQRTVEQISDALVDKIVCQERIW